MARGRVDDSDDPPAAPDSGTGASAPRWTAGQHSASRSPASLLRSPVVLVLIVVVVLVGATLAVIELKGKGAQPTPVAKAYLSDWTSRDYAAMALDVEDPPSDFTTMHQQVVEDLDVTSWQYRLGTVTTAGSTAEATFTAKLALGGLGSWSYSNTLRLARVVGHWLVEWTPGTIFPSLPTGGHLSVQRTWPTRASVLGTGGTVLAGPTDVVTVGLQGNAIADPTMLTSALIQAGIDPTAIATALKSAAANPTEFIPIVDLPDARYEQVKPLIFAIPGTRFQRHTGDMAVTPDLAAHVVGSVGPVTAQELQQLGASYQANDTVGQVGIESQYEQQLAGTPGGAVQVIGPDGSVIATPYTVAPKLGVAVQTTLDLATQKAAEAAVGGVTLPVSLVAIQASTGDVLAAVSRPDTTSFDRAINGQYPPGSTFKVMTSTALLESGLTPSSPATCPKTLTVDGYTFKNFEGEALLNLSMLQAFALSCNTAFIGLDQSLTAAQLISAADEFGFNTTLQIGLPAFGGQIPSPVDDVEKAASAIGQGRVLASPLQMAAVAAAVDSGSYRAPVLVVGAADANMAPVPLPAAVVTELHTMMEAVVTNGTGVAANVKGGGQVYGKTGTAEFGNANPPMTHAWFIGFRGDIAFAIVVEGGGVGGTVAAPIAARFLRGL